MRYMHPEWTDRLDHWIELLKEDLYLPLGRIELEAFFTMDYLTPDEAMRGPFSPIAPGTPWRCPGKRRASAW